MPDNKIGVAYWIDEALSSLYVDEKGVAYQMDLAWQPASCFVGLEGDYAVYDGDIHMCVLFACC
jgi:hypothetical protein